MNFVFSMASKKRSNAFDLCDVVDKLDLSDDELIDDNDSDRNSDFDLSSFESDFSDEEQQATTSVTNASGNPNKLVSDTAGSKSMLSGQNSSDDDDDDDNSTINLNDCIWKAVEKTYTPPVDINFSGPSGISSSVTLNKESLSIQFFALFLTDNIMQTMVTETNRYAEQVIAASEVKSKSRMKRWAATTMTETKKFLGLIFTTGIVKKPRIEDYWLTDPVMATPIFNSTMPRDRFELLLRFWHFCNNEVAVEGNRLFKLKNICDALLKRFQALYTPGKEVSIDESMVLWRGRLIFRQYIPGKRHKYGVKLYMLCEHTGYVWNVLVYCGKMDPISGFGHAETVVLKLMEKLLDRGHALYVDNFYTSVPLAEALLNRKTLLCGTVRKNRKHLPKKVISTKLKKGQHIAEKKGLIVFEKWQDKREVLMLSTHHSGKMVESTRRSRLGNKKKKPESVLSYNTYMCGVDRMDQLMSYYSPLRKTLKWYRKVVLQHLDMALVNSYILYKKIGGTKRQVQFRKSVISSLLASDVRTNEDLPETSKPFRHHKISDLSRLSGQHYLALIPATASKKKCC